jgi:hypothetical protein
MELCGQPLPRDKSHKSHPNQLKRKPVTAGSRFEPFEKKNLAHGGNRNTIHQFSSP